MSKTTKMAIVAWLLVLIYYFYQYALRSAPSVMIPQLSEAFGLNALGVASIVGLFYYGYSPFSLITGVSLDRLGLRKVIPLGAFAVGLGAILFVTGNQTAASFGRFLQGAGGAVPLVGAVYIVSRYFPASKAATLIGAAQMFGMAGGFAGQFAVGPAIGNGYPWQNFWIVMGMAGIVLGIILWIFLPKEERQIMPENYLKSTMQAFKLVFTNPQSLLCGFIAALIFIPTTIFDMVWGVRFLQEGYGFDYGNAVMRSASVPFGWIIGCPLLGFISDRIGRRKPVMIGGAVLLLLCLTWALFGRPDVFPPFSVGLLIGIASGAGMIPYTVIKEANPPQFSGTATGVTNFINFTFSAMMGPVFGWLLVRNAVGPGPFPMKDYQITFEPLLFGVGLAIILTLFLKETGFARLRNSN
ncbi:MAG: MFS transporter [Bacteroidales bacterium]|jgi:MFS family permease